MVTDRQVKRLMRLLRMGRALAAAKADMTYKSILGILSWPFSNSRPIISNNYKILSTYVTMFNFLSAKDNLAGLLRLPTETTCSAVWFTNSPVIH